MGAVGWAWVHPLGAGEVMGDVKSTLNPWLQGCREAGNQGCRDVGM